MDLGPAALRQILVTDLNGKTHFIWACGQDEVFMAKVLIKALVGIPLDLWYLTCNGHVLHDEDLLGSVFRGPVGVLRMHLRVRGGAGKAVPAGQPGQVLVYAQTAPASPVAGPAASTATAMDQDDEPSDLPASYEDLVKDPRASTCVPFRQKAVQTDEHYFRVTYPILV